MPKLTTLTRDADINDVRKALVDAGREMLELRAIPKDKRGDTYEADLTEVANYINEHDLTEKAFAAGQRAIDDEARQARETELERRGLRGPRSHGVDPDDPDTEYRSMGRQLTEHQDYKDFATGTRGGKYVAEVRNLIGGYTAGAYDSGSDGWLPVGSPVLNVGSIQRRRLFLRDLMSVQSTGLKVVPYVRETNQITNETGAAMTSEGSAKAEVTMTFENYSAIIEKITAWIPATDEILTDAPTLRGYIDTRLTYMLDIREESQLLTGNGTSPNLPGLDNVSGIQTQSEVTGDFPATIGRAIGLVENVDGEANGVACNPITYWTAVTKRWANQFDNGFGGMAPSSDNGNVTWGLPTVRSRVIAAAVAYVADWKLGATVFDRQETTIKVGDQHSDWLIRNLLVILAEKRVGVAWHRPNLFVKATVPTT